MITLEFVHIIALFGIIIALYGKLWMKLMENSEEILNLKAQLRECERFRKDFEKGLYK